MGVSNMAVHINFPPSGKSIYYEISYHRQSPKTKNTIQTFFNLDLLKTKKFDYNSLIALFIVKGLDKLDNGWPQ
jgi:hypothetical protein